MLRFSRADLDRYGREFERRMVRGIAEPAKVRANAAEYGPELREAAKTWGGEAWQRIARQIEQQTGNAVPALPFDCYDSELRAQAAMAAGGMYSRALAGGSSLPGVRASCEAECIAWGINPPAADLTDKGAIARMFDSGWWARRLRAAHGRRIEAAAIGAGYVSRFAGCYVSDVNLARRQDQKARNRKTLEGLEVENQYGDVFTLAELADKANANPRIRRAELMTRIAGFEACAAALGHVAEFWTVTCPSRFHARRSDDGRANQKYDAGKTPKDAQDHLVATWAKCRAALQRRGVRAYGFRIAEPHHDGCPHWHLLLFMPADAVEKARALVLRYFLEQHEPHEAGARAQRCKFVAIEPGKGSAVGYVAKYVAKSIDGYGLEKDLLGNPALLAAERVEAWAATWGIRQFQQIGGAPVGVWRELRRMTGEERLTDAAEQARQAANAGAGKWAAGWAEYMRIQGGPMVKRADLVLTCARTPEGEKWDAAAGAMVPAENAYGEPCARSVWGVRDTRREIAWASRRFKWIAPKGDRAGLGIAAEKAAKVAKKAAGTEGQDAAERAAKAADRARRRRGSGLARPQGRAAWTRVNNCTGVGFESSTNGGYSGRAGGIEGARGARKDAGDVPLVDRRAVGGTGEGARGDSARSGVHRRDGRRGEQWQMR